MPKKISRKMDPRLIATKQIFELNHVRLSFHKFDGDKIKHPTIAEVVAIARGFNHSRKKTYNQLERNGYEFRKLRKD